MSDWEWLGCFLWNHTLIKTARPEIYAYFMGKLTSTLNHNDMWFGRQVLWAWQLLLRRLLSVFQHVPDETKTVGSNCSHWLCPNQSERLCFDMKVMENIAVAKAAHFTHFQGSIASLDEIPKNSQFYSTNITSKLIVKVSVSEIAPLQ